MPRLIDGDGGDAISLDELVDRLDAEGVDARDEDAFAAHGPWLARLARDPRFLGDLAIRALAEGLPAHDPENRYGPQVMLLRRGRGWFVRANIWPAADDAAFRASGPAAFFYGLPHDHNFSFLTVGYFGPGYDSDYWERDGLAAADAPGDPAGLRFAGRQRLGPGRTMLYRAHRDVHSQLPPQSLSVTLNIMESTGVQPFLDQHRFDTGRNRIDGLVNGVATEAALALAGRLGGDAASPILDRIASHHPSDRLRFAALRARAATGGDGEAVLARGLSSASGYVRAMCRRQLDARRRAAAWRAD